MGPSTPTSSAPASPAPALQDHPREILDLGMDVGTGLLAHGASVSTAAQATLAAMGGRGMSEVNIDVTNCKLTVSVRADQDVDPVTAMRVVSVGHQDLARIQALLQVLRGASRRPAPEVHRELAPAPHRQGVSPPRRPPAPARRPP